MKPQILFVDDEAKILQGLKRTLRPLRNEWDVDFAVGGAEALEKMAAQPADVVVSDMRMPGMEGSVLLDRVREAYPATVRFVLSGQCDEDSVYRLTANSHQFFAKPCDAERLTAAIRAVLLRREAVASPDCRLAAARAAILPGDPEIDAALRAALVADAPPMEQVAELVAGDPALVAKLLQLSSSAYFGTGSSVTSLVQAIQRLGADTLKRLILDHGLPAPLSGNAQAASIWQRSRERGALARQIARSEELGEDQVELAGLSGLLLQAGDLLLTAESESACRAQSTALGAYLLSLWGLPQPIVETVAFHAAPAEAPDPQNRLLAVVHAAAHLTADPEATGEPGLDLGFLGKLGLEARVPVWSEAAASLGGGGDD